MRLPAPRQFWIFAPLGADCKAVTGIEYALLTAIMAMVIVTGLCLFGGDVSGTYGHVSDGLNNANLPAIQAAAASASTPVSPTASPTASTTGDSNTGSSAGQTAQTKIEAPGTH
jgi:Flp pilus assembly pilin Flp